MTKTTDEKHLKAFRKVGDSIQGDRIYARCQKPGDWIIFRKSDTHRGWKCTLTKDAYARIERAFTNTQT
jgi:hypothetical protein